MGLFGLSSSPQYHIRCLSFYCVWCCKCCLILNKLWIEKEEKKLWAIIIVWPIIRNFIFSSTFLTIQTLLNYLGVQWNVHDTFKMVSVFAYRSSNYVLEIFRLIISYSFKQQTLHELPCSNKSKKSEKNEIQSTLLLS